jgi:glycosyltransferase involved in cell wall biosynthesis
MKIGVFGCMAGTPYVFAKAFVQAGINILYVRDRSDSYLMHQPLWSDVKATISYGDLTKGHSWTVAEMTAWEESFGWKPPSWIVDPLPEELRTCDAMSGHAPRNDDTRVLEYLRSCDFLLVNGTAGVSYAHRSGRPYTIWPHGGDIRIAAGLARPDFAGIRQWWRYRCWEWSITKAFRAAAWISTHDPNLVGVHLGSVEHVARGVKYLPSPVELHPRKSPGERLHLRQELFERLGMSLPKGKHVFFVPSRVDYFWKGQDLLLEAFIAAGCPDIGFVFSAWGKDYQALKSRVAGSGLTDKFVFLPFALSRPQLIEMFTACDAIVDQFHGGTYGTSAVEAMACGSPVLMRVDTHAFQKRRWEPPPVLNARTVEEIAGVLGAACDGRIDLEAESARIIDWVNRTHRSDLVAAQFIRAVTEYMRTRSRERVHCGQGSVQ